MRIHFLTPGALLALCSLLAPAAAAGSVERGFVPADARWLVHVDVRGILGSEIAQACERLGLCDEINAEELGEIQRELGIDPRKDIASVTAYGASDDPERAVILIDGAAALETALERMSAHLVGETVEADGLTATRWHEDHDDEAFYTYLARKPGTERRVLLVSPFLDELARGVGVLRGSVDSLADQGSTLGPAHDGALVFAAAHEGFSHLADFDPTSKVADLVTSAEFELGEIDKSAYVTLTVGTDQADQAQQVTAILQGGLALVSLVAQSEAEAEPFVPLVQGLSVRTEGTTIRVHFQESVDTLAGLLEQEVSDDRPSTYKQPRRDKPSGGNDWY